VEENDHHEGVVQPVHGCVSVLVAAAFACSVYRPANGKFNLRTPAVCSWKSPNRPR